MAGTTAVHLLVLEQARALLSILQARTPDGEAVAMSSQHQPLCSALVRRRNQRRVGRRRGGPASAHPHMELAEQG